MAVAANTPIATFSPSDFDHSRTIPVCSGSFTSISILRKKNGEFLAMKLYANEQSEQQEMANAMRTRELGVLKRVNRLECDSIVEMKGIFMKDNRMAGLVFEYAELGNWERFLEKYGPLVQDKRGTLFEIICFHALCIARALSYLKTIKVIYNSLDLSNVLIFRNGFRAKLCDFSAAVWDNRDLDVIPGSRPAEKNILAPELLGQDAERPSFATDVYSFGVLLFHALARNMVTWPYDDEAPENEGIGSWRITEITNRLRSLPDFFEGHQVVDMIVSCLGDDRPNIESIEKDLKTLVDDSQVQLKKQKNILKTIVNQDLISPSPLRLEPMVSPVLSTMMSPVPMTYEDYQVFGIPNFHNHKSVSEQFTSLRIGVDNAWNQSFSGDHSHISPQPIRSISMAMNQATEVEDIGLDSLRNPEAKPTQSWITSIICCPDVQCRWRAVLLKLGLTMVDINCVENFRDSLTSESGPVNIDEASVVYYALDQIWLERHYDTVTRRRLVKALLDCQCRDSVSILLQVPDDVD